MHRNRVWKQLRLPKFRCMFKRNKVILSCNHLSELTGWLDRPTKRTAHDQTVCPSSAESVWQQTAFSLVELTNVMRPYIHMEQCTYMIHSWLWSLWLQKDSDDSEDPCRRRRRMARDGEWKVWRVNLIRILVCTQRSNCTKKAALESSTVQKWIFTA